MDLHLHRVHFLVNHDFSISLSTARILRKSFASFIGEINMTPNSPISIQVLFTARRYA